MLLGYLAAAQRHVQRQLLIRVLLPNVACIRDKLLLTLNSSMERQDRCQDKIL